MRFSFLLLLGVFFHVVASFTFLLHVFSFCHTSMPTYTDQTMLKVTKHLFYLYPPFSTLSLPHPPIPPIAPVPAVHPCVIDRGVHISLLPPFSTPVSPEPPPIPLSYLPSPDGSPPASNSQQKLQLPFMSNKGKLTLTNIHCIHIPIQMCRDNQISGIHRKVSDRVHHYIPNLMHLFLIIFQCGEKKTTIILVIRE